MQPAISIRIINSESINTELESRQPVPIKPTPNQKYRRKAVVDLHPTKINRAPDQS
jgi:hypothetical protein